MKVVSWNYRGLGTRKRRAKAMTLIKKEKPSVVILQETKLNELDIITHHPEIWNKSEMEAMSSCGDSGGVCTLWDPTNLLLVSTLKSFHWIATKIFVKNLKYTSTIINIYMLNNYVKKKYCWKSLQDLKHTDYGTNCILGGDFNTVLKQDEKREGAVVREIHQEDFEDLLMQLNLFDVKPSKFKYTWNNKRAGLGHIEGRLDIFLASDLLLSSLVSISLEIWPWCGSDH